jgi:hypothetical protein
VSWNIKRLTFARPAGNSILPPYPIVITIAEATTTMDATSAKASGANVVTCIVRLAASGPMRSRLSAYSSPAAIPRVRIAGATGECCWIDRAGTRSAR